MESRSFKEAKPSSSRQPRSRPILVDVSDHVPRTVSARARPASEQPRPRAAAKKPEHTETLPQRYEEDVLVDLRARLQNPVLFEDVDDPAEDLPKQEGMRAMPRREVGWGTRVGNYGGEPHYRPVTWDYGHSERMGNPETYAHTTESRYWANSAKREHRIGKVDDDYARNETQSIELANAMVDLFGVRKAKKILERVLKTGLERDVIPMDLAVKEALADRLVSCPPLEQLIEQPYHVQIAALLPAFRALYRGEALGSDKTPVEEHVPEDWVKPPKEKYLPWQREPKTVEAASWQDRFYADVEQAYINRDQAERGGGSLSEDDQVLIWMQNQGGAGTFEDQLELYMKARVSSQPVDPRIDRLVQRYPEALAKFRGKSRKGILGIRENETWLSEPKRKVNLQDILRRDRYQPLP